ncbi:MAG TPA: glycoside hydrolase family 3 N-terminal domain-containing protein [Bacteroidales bacterium]|nr:glycoside hydrolase family 3 N-terminal domain-containing protein [Bacteroidales bacterium]
MKKILKILLYTIGVLLAFLILLVVAGWLLISISSAKTAKKSKELQGAEVKTLTIDGFTFRDLNKNGRLDAYEDSREPVGKRVDDLISQMNIDEKAGTMFFSMISMKKDGSVSEKPSFSDPFSFLMKGTSGMIFMKHINHFNILFGTGKKEMATWNNNIQKLAERTRLGIPVTTGTDPRNHFSTNPLASGMAGDLSQYPEPIGLAAIGDTQSVYEFANNSRQEYLAAGIRVALHPQIDLATEPRWGRISGTFGEDAELTSHLATAYIKGFQGDSVGVGSVACMTKHFPGGGPQKEGIDPHFKIQKGQVYPGKNFNYHLIPFQAALKAGTAEIMPYYGVPRGLDYDEVGFSFNHEIITGLLRKKYHFDGIVCTDWGIISDWKIFGQTIMAARAWGVTRLSEEGRVEKVINAGVDQFGGETCPELIVKLVREGKISEARIDTSVRRLLRMKFILGLFENPFVDVDNAVATIGKPEFRAAGELAQRKALVLLKNDTVGRKSVLPLRKGIKIYIKGIKREVAAKYATVVKKPEEADYAIIRLNTPSQHLKGAGLLGMMFGSGDLDFKEKQKSDILDLLTKVPGIVDIYLGRPAVIPEISTACRGLIANFGSSDEALLDVIFGDFNPQGNLPFELPSSMAAVRSQKEDVPYDSENPLYKFGFGLHYHN